MAPFVRSDYLFIVVTLSFSVSCCFPASASTVKAAYWPSWSSSPPSAIDTSLFTHIYYAFLMPNNVTYNFEISNSKALILSNFTTTLHHKEPPVKALFSIGGGDADSSVFARMASSPVTRKAYINSTLEVARNLGFDGMDLDWEFPEDPKQMLDLSVLFDEWREAIEAEAKATNRAPLLLTAAVYYSVDFLQFGGRRSYPVRSINQNLDWINAMCYDFHGSWDTSKTGAHAALYDPNSNISTSYGLTSWVKAGVYPEKVVMGLPLYGKTWKLKDPNQHTIGSDAVGVGPGKDGVLTFAQVEKFNTRNNATVAHDMVYVSAYSFVGTSWIGYDDATSATIKVKYAYALGLRGYFFWAVSYDSEWEVSSAASRAWTQKE
ncbi:hypothetical protein SLEP1_g15670 [Rubroshorea leprosula]|uniref:GH18 domain-containing protein n=1 Tax=Rubroshorea leprosula TaxID=152421 RepID=A0AAV5IYW6_9ROSI|nr:hypothetical protein SLEP1_g15670 [Rubroshorea leprosula]